MKNSFYSECPFYAHARELNTHKMMKLTKDSGGSFTFKELDSVAKISAIV